MSIAYPQNIFFFCGVPAVNAAPASDPNLIKYKVQTTKYQQLIWIRRIRMVALRNAYPAPRFLSGSGSGLFLSSGSGPDPIA
jgi:hypothetical protein